MNEKEKREMNFSKVVFLTIIASSGLYYLTFSRQCIILNLNFFNNLVEKITKI